MSSALAIVGQQPTSLSAPGGLGLDFGSKLFQLKPATISINQPMTRAEGAIKGKYRIAETGDQYDELFVTLLTMPVEKRAYYLETPDGMNRNNDNLMCFSNDNIKPHDKAKVPQAMKCSNCPKASWEKWRQTKAKEDLPGCDSYYYVLFIDTVYQMPLQMYVRGGAKQAFEQGMQNLSRKFAMMKAQGLNPNIFDIGFKMKTKKVEKGTKLSWVPELSDFAAITSEQKEQFGDIYTSFLARGQRPDESDGDAETAQIEQAGQSIDQATGAGSTLDGEYLNDAGGFTI